MRLILKRSGPASSSHDRCHFVLQCPHHSVTRVGLCFDIEVDMGIGPLVLRHDTFYRNETRPIVYSPTRVTLWCGHWRAK